MNLSFVIPIDFDEEVKESDSKSGVCRFLTDTIKHLRQLPGKFGQMPFDRLITIEGQHEIANHGQQIQYEDLDKQIGEWFSNVIDLAKSEIFCHNEVCSLNVTLSDDDLTFGYRIAVTVGENKTPHYFTVIPVTEDICADKETPYRFTLVLRGDQQK